MSGGGARLTVVPTVTVLAMIKGRLIGANKGHGLLKKKADALTMRFRQILKEILDCKTSMGERMKDSYFALTEVKYAAGACLPTCLPSPQPLRPPGAPLGCVERLRSGHLTPRGCHSLSVYVSVLSPGRQQPLTPPVFTHG